VVLAQAAASHPQIRLAPQAKKLIKKLWCYVSVRNNNNYQFLD